MSICIAVLFDRDRRFVPVTDTKVTFGSFGADNIALKDQPFYTGWVALVAGDDVEHAAPILERASDILYANNTVPPPVPPIEVAAAVDQAFAERLQTEINARVLRKRGFTVETFRETGKDKCTPSAYLTLCNRIDQVSISLKFLLCGFDAEGGGHIYCVDGEGAPKCYDLVGMWAIGKGASAALGTLAFHAERSEFTRFRGKNEAVYAAVTAKFMAETSGLIGESTFVTIHGGNEAEYVAEMAMRAIRRLWETKGAPRIPQKEVNVILRDAVGNSKQINEYDAAAFISMTNKLRKTKAAGKQ